MVKLTEYCPHSNNYEDHDNSDTKKDFELETVVSDVRFGPYLSIGSDDGHKMLLCCGRAEVLEIGLWAAMVHKNNLSQWPEPDKIEQAGAEVLDQFTEKAEVYMMRCMIDALNKWFATPDGKALCPNAKAGVNEDYDHIVVQNVDMETTFIVAHRIK